MKPTKALFFELMYDFQSERWNEFELPKLSLRELLALAKLMGPDGAFITGSDFLMDGGVTAAYRFGDLAPK
jgi:hypothetical protein